MRFIAIVISNGATSLVSLMLTLAIGRQDGPGALGVFGVCFAVLSLVQLFAQEVGINRALTDPKNTCQRQIGFSRSITIALIVAIPVIGIGLLLWNPIVVLTATAIPSYVAFAFLRLLTMTDGKIRRGLLADILLVFTTATATLITIIFDMSSTIVLLTWALALPVSSLLLQMKLGVRFQLGWYAGSKYYSGLNFGFQSLLGSGTVHIATFVLAGFFGSVLVGAIRGVSTLLGPVNLVTTSMNTMSIRQLGVAPASRRKRTVWTWFLFSTSIALVGSGITYIFVMSYGEWLLGESWPVVKALVLLKCIDAVLVAVGVTPRAAHRVDRRDASAWKVSIVSGLMRLVLLPIGGWWAGAAGVVTAEIVTTLLTSLFWWVSYAIYRARNKTGDPGLRGADAVQHQE